MSSASSDLYAAVDLGGTHFTVVLGGADGRIAAERKEQTRSQEGPDAVIRRIGETVRALAAERACQPRAVGLGVPGLVDVARGITRFLPNLPTQWRDITVREKLSPLVGAPVYLLNDARAATLGEMEFGAGRTASTFFCFTLGTGVGGGVVIDRRLHLGPLGAAGEIGHIVVESAGPRCGCGTTGCLETFASGPALTAEAVRLMTSGNSSALHARVGGDLSRLNPAVLGEVARAGDEACLRVVERAGEKLGIASASLVTALHPDLIVLVGGVAGLADLLIPAMRRVIVARVHMFPVDDLRIERSPLGDRAGVLGALALAIRGGSVGAA